MIVEGQTEQKFANEVIKEHLASCNIGVSIRCRHFSEWGVQLERLAN
jgi:hypothetical protein